MKRKSINIEIAQTHIRTRRKQTLVAALGVTIELGMFIFSTSLMSGFTKYSTTEMFKTIAHVKVFKEDQISKPLYNYADTNKTVIIANPRTVPQSKSINDPYALLEEIRKKDFVTYAAPQVNIDLFYNNGESQLKGNGSGVNIAEADAMFNIRGTMLAGDFNAFSTNLNAVYIGEGGFEKMKIGIRNKITIRTEQGFNKGLKVSRYFTMGKK